MSKAIINHPRVEYYDNDCGDGHIVTLRHGYAWSDAAKEGEDPEGRTACHTRRFETVADFRFEVRFAQPCRCGRCEREGA